MFAQPQSRRAAEQMEEVIRAVAIGDSRFRKASKVVCGRNGETEKVRELPGGLFGWSVGEDRW